MGLAISQVEFEEGLEDISLLSKKLREHTKVNIEMEISDIDAKSFDNAREAKTVMGNYKYFKNLEITFKPTDDKRTWYRIECSCKYKEKAVDISIESSLDPFNKYPCYFHFAMLACLVNLGGKYYSSSSFQLPTYSYWSWDEWVINNGSSFPPLWKKVGIIVFQIICMIPSFLYFIFVYVPILLILLGFSWIIFFLKGRQASEDFVFRFGHLLKIF